MGSSFQYFDIILFAMIAVFLVLRLRSVLGRRDQGPRRGHVDPFARLPEKERLEKERRDDTVVSLPGRKERQPAEPAPPPARLEETGDPVLGAGYAEIRAQDSSFDPKEFVVGARVAFETVLKAYSAADTKTLRALLSPEVFSHFESAVKERLEKDEKLEVTLVSFRAADIIEAWMEGRVAHVTVKFVTEQVYVVRDKDGQVLQGDANAITDVTDIWTFARDTKARDPNWSLVATRSPN